MRHQVASKLSDRFGDDHDELLELCSDLYAVHVNGSWHFSLIPERLKVFAAKYAVILELGSLILNIVIFMTISSVPQRV